MIWFKNAQVYRLNESFVLSSEQLQNLLAKHPFSPCGKQQPVSQGWVSPVKDSDQLVHISGGNWLLCLQRQQRLLPSSVINETLAERVETLQLTEDRRIGRKEKQSLKDDIVFELLPKAFVKTNRHYLFINPEKQLLMVDAASESLADDITGFLRQTLGTLPLGILSSDCQPAQVLTHWLIQSDKVPAHWQLLPELEVSYSDSDARVKLKNLELESQALQQHLDNALVTQIAVEWHARLRFVLNQKAQLKRIKFSDELIEQVTNDSGETAAEQIDASFTLMAAQLTELIEDLMAQFGTSARP